MGNLNASGFMTNSLKNDIQDIFYSPEFKMSAGCSAVQQRKQEDRPFPRVAQVKRRKKAQPAEHCSSPFSTFR